MRRTGGLAIVVMSMAFACGGIGCGKPDPASVRGRVALNVEEDEPAGAVVRIGENRTETGADGAFELTGVASGARTLRAAKEGYEPRERTVSLEPGGRKDVGTIELQRENEAPVVENLSAMPADIEPGGMATVEVTASDPDGDMLRYSWEVPTAGWSVTVGGEPTSAELTAPDEHGASGTVTVTVDDGFGGSTVNELLVSTTVE